MPNEPRESRGWNRYLPAPYNQDLSGVLRHLNRRTREYRERLANDPVTIGLLAAGMRLVAQRFGPGARRRADQERMLLQFLSQRALVAELARNPQPFPKAGTVATLRDRWRSQADFVDDLINFAVLLENYRPGYREQQDADADALVNGPDFVDAVHRAAYRHTAEGISRPSVRFALALMTTADGDEAVSKAITAVYQDYLNSWKKLYTDVMRARHLRLRPGLSMDDLANALSVATDGAILRSIADPDAGLLDHERKRSLMGTVALAIIHAFLEPDDDADGRSLEQAVAARFAAPGDRP